MIILLRCTTQEGITESHTVIFINSTFVVLPAQVFFHLSGPRKYVSAKCENELL